MDRVIALLAALVGLIALGGAVLVNARADAQQQAMATEIAELRVALGQPASARPAAPASAASEAPPADDGVADALFALQDRIATLEQSARDQADALEAAQAELAARPAATPATEVATAAAPGASSMPAAVSEDGPTTDCIPLGTRFVGTSGDSFPICKTRVVVDVAGVSDGIATISGAGDIAVGATTGLSQAGCSLSVFSADIASGYAEMRVSCL